MKLVRETAEDFFEIPIGITEDLVQDLADGLGHLFQDYISFAASCGETKLLHIYSEIRLLVNSFISSLSI